MPTTETPTTDHPGKYSLIEVEELDEYYESHRKNIVSSRDINLLHSPYVATILHTSEGYTTLALYRGGREQASIVVNEEHDIDVHDMDL